MKNSIKSKTSPASEPDTKDAKDTQIAELTADLKRQRADFENYRKNVDADRTRTVTATEIKTILRLLPILDDLDLALNHAPADLPDHAWIAGVLALSKKLNSTLDQLGVKKITARPGTAFDPNLHEALSGEGDRIAEELRAGYTLAGQTLRPSLVRVDGES
ncbi:nucleotide exchange factor GrpE [Candidatus Saccharibacteria bacterium]|nr:nucleotide exchange factor GrpE [Candidatus Saccharibacteria bacterium]